MKDTGYIQALEMRCRWLRWWEDEPGVPPTIDVHAKEMYRHTLKCGPTYYMNSRFCQLVDQARQTMPEDIAFDETWLISPVGWIWLSEPADMPNMILGPKGHIELHSFHLKLRAVGWMKVSDGYEIMYYCETPQHDWFVPWAYFGVAHGDTLRDRMADLEEKYAAQNDAGSYDLSSPESKTLHEMRWVYAALHTMSLKLAASVRVDCDRNTRRRMVSERSPHEPFVNVVTLRRMEQERQERGIAHDVDWQWQWIVTHHWRRQFYKSTGEYKTILIDDYVKGPEDKPLKPTGHRIYVAKR